MGWDTMLGEDVDKKELGKLQSSDSIVGGDENALFGQSVYDDQDGGEAIGVGELLDEVHGDGVPGFLGDRKLLEGPIGTMTWNLGSSASGAGLAVILDKRPNLRPGVLSAD
jgi:hypothetical protein